MSLFGNRPRTAQQKAQWAKTRIMIRGAALVYIVFYVVLPMIRADVEEADAINPTLRIAIIVFFIVVCIALSIGTILEYIRNNKAGLYKAEAYTDDEGAGGGSVAEAASGDEEDEDNDDDEYDDDEDYDDEDYDEEEEIDDNHDDKD